MVAFRVSWGGFTSSKRDKGSAGSMGLVDCKLFCSILGCNWLVAVVFERCLVMSW